MINVSSEGDSLSEMTLILFTLAEMQLCNYIDMDIDI